MIEKELLNLIQIIGDDKQKEIIRKQLMNAIRMTPKENRNLLKQILERKEIKFLVSGYESAHSSVYCPYDLDDNHNPNAKAYVYLTSLIRSGTFYHELGHATKTSITKPSRIKYNRVEELFNAFHKMACEELDEKKEFIYQSVMDEFHHLLNGIVSKKQLEKIQKYLSLHQELYKLNQELPNRNYPWAIKDFMKENNISQEWLEKKYKRKDEIMAFLTKYGYVDAFLEIRASNSAEQFNKIYYPIIDALSVHYDIGLLGFCYHPRRYYENKSSISDEMFANLFEAKMLGQDMTLENFKGFLPKTYALFEKAFQIIKDYYSYDLGITSITTYNNSEEANNGF